MAHSGRAVRKGDFRPGVVDERLGPHGIDRGPLEAGEVFGSGTERAASFVGRGR
jgi:hypothetical protein